MMLDLTFQEFQWLFQIITTLHNLEEAIWLPKWSQQVGKWHAEVGKVEFRFAVIVLTLLAYLFTYLSWFSGPQTIWVYITCGYMFAMWLNVFLPHVLATIDLRRYCPGVVTGVVLNLPINAWLIYLGLQQQWISLEKFLYISPLTVIAILFSIPVLFFTGKKLFN